MHCLSPPGSLQSDSIQTLPHAASRCLTPPHAASHSIFFQTPRRQGASATKTPAEQRNTSAVSIGIHVPPGAHRLDYGFFSGALITSRYPAERCTNSIGFTFLEASKSRFSGVNVLRKATKSRIWPKLRI